MFNYIKNTFLDIFVLYKNFFHWNLNKIIIYIWSFIFAFLLSLPFLGLLFLFSYLFWVDIAWLFNSLINNQVTTNLYINISFYIITIIFFISNFYKYILLNKLNFDYLKWQKSKILDNYFFDLIKIKKYFVISLINLFFLLLLSLIFFLIFVIIFFVFWGSEWIQSIISTWNNNIFSIISLIVSIIFVISFLYLIYRLVFSYYILSDNKNSEIKPFEYIKKSFKMTKWFKKVSKLVSLIIIFWIFFIPSYIAITFYDNNMINVSNYVTYKYWSNEEQKDSFNKTYVQSLEYEFTSLTLDELNSLFNRYWNYIILINIFNFILFFWMFPMLTTSFYKRVLLDDNK